VVSTYAILGCSALTEYMFVPRNSRGFQVLSEAQAAAAPAPGAGQSRPKAKATDRGAAAAAQHVEATQQAPAAAGPAATFIRQLDIRNLALIEHQRITLQPGLTVVSGESGEELTLTHRVNDPWAAALQLQQNRLAARWCTRCAC